MNCLKTFLLMCLLSSVCCAKVVKSEKASDAVKDNNDAQRDTRQTKQTTTLATMPTMTTTTMPQMQQVQLAMPRYPNYGETMFGGIPNVAGYPGVGLAGLNGLNYPGNNFQQQQQIGVTGFGVNNPLYPGIFGQGVNGFNQQPANGFIDPQLQAQNPNYLGLANIVNMANLPGLQQPGMPFPQQQPLFPQGQQQPLFPQAQQQLIGQQQFPQQFGVLPGMGPFNNNPLSYGDAFQNYV